MMLANNNILLKNDLVLVPNSVADRDVFVGFTIGGNDWQGRGNLVKTNSGVWVLVWAEGTNHSDRAFATAIFNIAFSEDEGDNWTANNIDIDGNPVVGFPLVAHATGAVGVGAAMDMCFFKAPNGDLILLAQERVPSGASTWNGANVTISQWRSTNEGKTFLFDFDFPASIGLTSVAQKGSIQGLYEHIIIGTDIYVAAMITETVLADSRTVLIKSSDNADTWAIVNDIVGVGERPDAWTECGLIYKGGTTIGVVGAPNGVNFNAVEYRETNDLGGSWEPVRSIYVELGYTGIHQPTMILVGNNVLLSGRDVKKVVGNNLLSLRDRCSVWSTPLNNIFNNNTRRDYLDPFYAGSSTVALSQGDAGYGRALQKADGSMFYVGYYGTAGASRLYKYSVSHVDLPSQEIYANNEFLPESIQEGGVRLEMNRDNIVDSGGAPVSGGLAIASFLDNYLDSPNDDYWWIATATTASELIVDSQGKGWIQFINGHFASQIDVGNTYFKANFSMSMKLRPSDGQPAATNVIFWCNSNTTSGLSHGISITLTTAGKLQFSYVVAGVVVRAETLNAVYANGAILTESHVVFLVPSGGTISIIVNGVTQTLAVAPNNGDMSTVTMASFANTLPLFLGRRRTGVSTFDLPYVGLMREFMIFPSKLLSAGEITNLSLL